MSLWGTLHLNIVPNDVGAQEIAGCELVPGGATASGGFSNAVIAINPAEIVGEPGPPSSVALTVVDQRPQVVMERTATFDVKMSAVVLQPGEMELIRSVVGAKLGQVAAELPPSSGPQTVVCAVTKFSVTTPATAFYWDVTTDVLLTLSAGDQQREARGHAVKRTYLWPSETLIKTVTVEALKQVAAESDTALRELLLAQPVADSASPH